MYQCGACGRRQTKRSTSALCGYRFPDDIIALAMRWYLRFRLPCADIVELLAKRGVHVAASRSSRRTCSTRSQSASRTPRAV